MTIQVIVKFEMASQEKRVAKVSLVFCSFDSSVDHMMLLPGSSKLVNSLTGPTKVRIQPQSISDKINRILIPLISTTAFARVQ